MRLTRSDIDIPPGAADHLVVDEGYIPVDVELLFIQPHAHYLGKTISGTAYLPDGTKKSLLQIDAWDFNWQDGYEYTKPVFLPEGTRVEMRTVFDNSADNPRNPNQPPKRVTTGWKTTDEMADLFLQLLAKDPADQLKLKRDLIESALRDELTFHLVELNRELQKNPEDTHTKLLIANGHNTLGISLGRVGRLEEAIGHFRNAIELKPETRRGPDQFGNRTGAGRKT